MGDVEGVIRLNEIEPHKDKACAICGRKYPNTLLNVEGVIHHGMKYRCYDLKSCRRASRQIVRKSQVL